MAAQGLSFVLERIHIPDLFTVTPGRVLTVKSGHLSHGFLEVHSSTIYLSFIETCIVKHVHRLRSSCGCVAAVLRHRSTGMGAHPKDKRPAGLTHKAVQAHKKQAAGNPAQASGLAGSGAPTAGANTAQSQSGAPSARKPPATGRAPAQVPAAAVPPAAL